MTHPLLRLTADENKWCSYRGEGGKPAVIERAYAQTGSVASATPLVTLIQQGTRRARVHTVTWTGDVAALRVRIRTSVGEELTVGGPVHVPLLSGHSGMSTATISASVATYPNLKTGNLPGGPPAFAAPPAWTFIIEPNTVLPGNQQFICEYTPENPTEDFSAAPYNITQVIHVWEFPGYEGGA